MPPAVARLRGVVLAGWLLLIAAGPSPALAALLYERNDLRALVVAYKATLPGAGSNAFVPPTDTAADALVGAARAALRGDLAGAAATLDALGYDLIVLDDTGGSGEHLVLRERVPCARCWGLYVLRRTPTACNVLVQAPHPLFDGLTPELALEAYVRTGAVAFAMAGTHRYANGPNSQVSDMARNPRSVFQRLHEALSDPATHVLQYHGFAQRDPPYPAVVLSNGSREPHAELYALQATLAARGETAGVYDGEQYRDLAGGQNPQGRHTRSIGGRFYHMEHEPTLRRTPARVAAAVDAVVAVVGEPPACGPHAPTPVAEAAR
jgi:hypothetical protein